MENGKTGNCFCRFLDLWNWRNRILQKRGGETVERRDGETERGEELDLQICSTVKLEYCETGSADLQICRSRILQKRRGETVERRGGEEERRGETERKWRVLGSLGTASVNLQYCRKVSTAEAERIEWRGWRVSREGGGGRRGLGGEGRLLLWICGTAEGRYCRSHEGEDEGMCCYDDEGFFCFEVDVLIVSREKIENILYNMFLPLSTA